MWFPVKFNDLPIRRKLLLITLLSSAVAVVLVSGGFMSWDIIQIRKEIVDDVRAQAELLAEASGAAVAFQDPTVGDETLRALRFRPRVELACLYDAKGAVFASYLRPGAPPCPAAPPANAFGWSQLDLSAAVVLDGDRVGTLFIRRELSDTIARLRLGAATIVGLLLIAIGVAFLIASRMQRSIAAPLLQLADTARAISTGQDHSLRAVP